MKLRRYTGTQGSVLILDTGGYPPDRREWQLMCCRSLTLPVDTLLLGPVGDYPPFRVMAMDVDGLSVPVTAREAGAFAAFLRDEGYAGGDAIPVTDGAKLFPVESTHSGWWEVTAPEGLRLQRLLDL